MFWENAVGYLRNGEYYSFQTFAIVFSTREHFLVGISGSSRKERKPVSKLKLCFVENAVEYLRNGVCEGFQTFSILFSTPENLLVGICGVLGT